MIKNFDARAIGCLNGMRQAESAVGSALDASNEAMGIARLICESKTAEALAHKMPPSSWTRPSSAAMIGLIFHDRFGEVLDFCRAETLFSSPASQCAALGASILVSSACFEVPIGIWPNEVGAILKGVDNFLVSMVNETTIAATGECSDEEFISGTLNKTDPDTGIVIVSLFACLRGHDFEGASTIARRAGPHVACLTGAVMGAAFPSSVKEQDASAKEILDMIAIRRAT